MKLSATKMKFYDPDENGKPYNLLEATKKMKIYVQVTDAIFHSILHWDDPNDVSMMEARDLLLKINKRELYKHITTFKCKEDKENEEEGIKSYIERKINELYPELNKNDLVIESYMIDFGKGRRNPINNLYFYRKTNPTQGIKIAAEEVSDLLPVKYCDRNLSVYCKENNEKVLRKLKKITNDIKSTEYLSQED